MFRRLMILAVLAALFAVLAEAALGVNVKVRVEGKTQTIYGAAEPTIGTTGAFALDTLEAASSRGEFYYHVTQFSFGPFVDQIGRYKAEGSDGWTFKVNGVSPQVGADKVAVKDGDVVALVLGHVRAHGRPADPGAPAHQEELLRRDRAGRHGRAQPASGAALLVDGKRRSTREGRACIGRHVGLVRANRTGAVRSNALR